MERLHFNELSHPSDLSGFIRCSFKFFEALCAFHPRSLLPREAEQKRARAERRWGLSTGDSNVFNGSSESFFDAILFEENEKRLAEVHQEIFLSLLVEVRKT